MREWLHERVMWWESDVMRVLFWDERVMIERSDEKMTWWEGDVMREWCNGVRGMWGEWLDERVMLLDERVMLWDERVMLWDERVMLLDERVMLLDERVMLWDGRVMLWDERVRWLASPSLQGGPSWRAPAISGQLEPVFPLRRRTHLLRLHLGLWNYPKIKLIKLKQI